MKEQVFSKGKDFLLDILYDVASSIMMAISINVFTAPNGIAPGGISGIAIIINHFTGLPIGTLNLAMNIPLLLIGYKVLGRRFTFNTLKTIAIGTVFLDVILVNLPTYTSNPLLGALFGRISGLSVPAGLHHWRPGYCHPAGAEEKAASLYGPGHAHIGFLRPGGIYGSLWQH